jgi:hypothetical protein
METSVTKGGTQKWPEIFKIQVVETYGHDHSFNEFIKVGAACISMHIMAAHSLESS